MKLKKHAKPLAEATIGDFTERKCGLCGLFLQFAEVDPNEKVAWLSCPTYMAEHKHAKSDHSSYTVDLAETGYKEGDSELRAIKEGPHREGRKQHDRPNVVLPPRSPGMR